MVLYGRAHEGMLKIMHKRDPFSPIQLVNDLRVMTEYDMSYKQISRRNNAALFG